jgi:hypothetical protein
MKKLNLLCSCLALVAASTISSCTGNEENDGNKSLEGEADPANTGGKLGGSQDPADRIDSTKID